ncbi:alpha/beta hydrolase [Patulibacter minatonensis]|uniref:alpha/beta hydrolase n=1 Tax=Patulibacter minatonensis TaxID=298163 RepID=UPI0004B44FA7|nr:alpha/beta hydrolase [Patulibacter minatonensis]
MPSPEAAIVFKKNQDLLAAWLADPEATIDDFRVIFEDFLGELEIPADATFEDVDAGGVPSIAVTAPGASTDQVVVHFHSGGYVLGSAKGYRSFGAYLSAATGARVLLVDYRLAPENPYPAAIDDALAAYDHVVAEGVSPSNIVISGDSAGGGLALVTLQALRDRGGEQPAAGVSISPWADFTLSGESMTTNAANDPIVPGPDLLAMMAGMIIGEDGDPRNPRVSPIFGDWTGLPPLLVFAGSIETLRDDGKRAVEAAKQAGVDATFIEGEGMVHIWPTYAELMPEAVEAREQIGAFVKSKVGAGATA